MRLLIQVVRTAQRLLQCFSDLNINFGVDIRWIFLDCCLEIAIGWCHADA